MNVYEAKRKQQFVAAYSHTRAIQMSLFQKLVIRTFEQKLIFFLSWCKIGLQKACMICKAAQFKGIGWRKTTNNTKEQGLRDRTFDFFSPSPPHLPDWVGDTWLKSQTANKKAWREREREIERETDRQRQTDREIETERDRGRVRERGRDRQRERKRERERERVPEESVFAFCKRNSRYGT